MKVLLTLLTVALVFSFLGGIAVADDSDTLRDLRKAIEKRLDAEKKKASPDREHMKFLEGVLKKYRPEGGEGSRREAWTDGSREVSGFVRRFIEGSLDDAGLSDEEHAAVTDILVDWWTSREVVRKARDRSAYADIDKDRDNRLKRLLGSKRANPIIENANRSARWASRGGRGGR